MKRLCLSACLFFLLSPLFGSTILYAEQYYDLYHRHFYAYPEDTVENIYYLGMALRADFCNPLYALAVIDDEREWEKYRYLFYMHVNLLLVESYLTLGSKYDKFEAYFYNEPWKEQILESLEIAESYYQLSREFWEDAVKWSDKAADSEFAWMTLEEIQYWEDQSFRIQNGSLNYDDIIDRQLSRIESVRQEYLGFDDTTY